MPATYEPRAAFLQAIERIEVALISVDDDASYPTSVPIPKFASLCGTPVCELRNRRTLAVNFQEVVHSARTGNADVAKHSDSPEDRMDTHKNARLTPKGREAMVRAVVDSGLSKAAAARRFNTTVKTVGKWVERFRAEGVNGLHDRSSRPLSSPSQIPL